MGVIPHASVDAFFHELVVAALEQQGVGTSESTECYLVGLLGEFTKGRITDEPLALVLANAEDSGERVKALKEVGDTSLYMTGFFAESLRKKIVRAEYYIHMGKAAYRELANRLCNSTVAEIYDELAARFPTFVDVLATVREQIDFCGADVTRLYEAWIVTRSEWIESRLRELGVLISASDDDESTLH